jgi:hypothetical protein
VPATSRKLFPRGKIDGGDDIIRRTDGYSVRAWPRGPGIDPAEGLRQPDLIPQEVWVLQLLEDMRAAGARWRFQAPGERRLNLDELPPDIPAEPVPACFRWPCRVTGTDPGH